MTLVVVVSAHVAGPPVVKAVIPTDTVTINTATRTNNSPVFSDVPPGGFNVGTFEPGNCTWWVAYNFPNIDWNGNAYQWGINAEAKGHHVGHLAKVGTIVVWPRGRGYDAKFGHVALVTKVTATYYTVSEMNYLGLGLVDQRNIRLPDGHNPEFIDRP